jgi:simple sugar transport system ATP-binding protein
MAEIELRDITKRFPGVVANNHINLAVDKGEIRALVGENGAGKTTLMRILYGEYQPDDGEILLRGKKVVFHSPLDAIRAGLGMVHQHFMLFNSLSVYENVIYGAEPAQYGFINANVARERVNELVAQYGLQVAPDARVGQLPVGVRQRVEIIKTLYRNAEILILDEPTAVLTPQEKDDLFVILRKLAARGKTILFITHKLNEVMEISDRATVLRNGSVITTLNTRETNQNELARHMVGRSVLLRVEKPNITPGETLLQVENLQVADERGNLAVRDVSLQVRAGELVGIAGVAGNGQTELIEALVGLRAPRVGRVLMRGQDVTRASVAERRARGMAYVPEDRGRVGLALDAALDENLLMGYEMQPKFSQRGVLQFDAIREFAQGLVSQYAIKTASVRDRASSLSGGNLQKTVVARELTHDAPVLIAEQPTRGVDIGSIEFIHQQLVEYQQRGHAILVVSAELSEIMSLADRILVMYEGRIVGETPASQATEHGLGLWMTGSSNQ